MLELIAFIGTLILISYIGFFKACVIVLLLLILAK